MNQTYYAGHRLAAELPVPFVHRVAPMLYVGDAIYRTIEVTGRVVGQGFAAIQTRMCETQPTGNLKILDDRTLNDIGTRRSQIGDVA